MPAASRFRKGDLETWTLLLDVNLPGGSKQSGVKISGEVLRDWSLD